MMRLLFDSGCDGGRVGSRSICSVIVGFLREPEEAFLEGKQTSMAPAQEGDAAASEARHALALRRTCRGAARFCRSAIDASVERAIRRYAKEIGMPVVAGRGHRALAMRRFRAALVVKHEAAVRSLTPQVPYGYPDQYNTMAVCEGMLLRPAGTYSPRTRRKRARWE